METKILSYFVHVADMGSFTKAAALTGVEQSKLSRYIRQLEVELHQTLLIRNGRGVSLTEAGQRWLIHCRGILHQLDRARQELEEQRGAPSGHVIVGVLPSIGNSIVPRLVMEFRRNFPKATIGVMEGLSINLLEALNTGRIDIGFLHNPAPSSQIEIKARFDDPLCLVSPAKTKRTTPAKGKPIAFTSLPQYELILANRPNALRLYVESKLADAGLRANVSLEVEGISSVLELVANGQGHAILPARRVTGTSWPYALTYHEIVRPRLNMSLAVALSSKRIATPLMEKVIELINTLGMR
jgi:LysR family nitrogen assimilation transcriptional regulator